MTGYCRINEYRHKLNQCRSSGYDCKETDAVQYFILERPLYEDNHKQLSEEFFLSTRHTNVNEMSIIPKDKKIKYTQK